MFAEGATGTVAGVCLHAAPMSGTEHGRESGGMSEIDDRRNEIPWIGNPKDEGAGSEEMATADGRGRVRDFDHGSIYWTPETGAHEVHGDIRVKFAQLGDWIGYPTTDETGCPDGVGRFNHFENGSIYWTPDTGAWEVHGAIRELWAQIGWERSHLGYPVTDESSCPDGVGRFNHFQGGSIYWTPDTGAHEVHGAIRERWSQLGWERSHLGYPVTSETACPDGVGRFNHYQGGSIYWTPDTGAHDVFGPVRDHWEKLGWERGRLRYPIADQRTVGDGFDCRFQGGVVVWTPSGGARVQVPIDEGPEHKPVDE